MKNFRLHIAALFTLILSFSIETSFAQLQTEGIPKSFSTAMSDDFPVVNEIDPPDLAPIALEDEEEPVPYRFAVNIRVDIGYKDFRKTIVNGGTVVAKTMVKSRGALGITLYFDAFRLPEGARLFVYNPRRTELLGAFTSLNNNRYHTFATRLLRGDEVIIEYNAPVSAPEPVLHISEIAYAYRGTEGPDGIMTGFGASGNCEVNINCSEGAAWQNQKRGVTRIQVKRGAQTLFCTGSLVNNTLNDGKPYILTADHCGRLSTEIDLSQWIFYLGYEGKNCPDPTKEPWQRSMTGATKIAQGGQGGFSGSDFFLVLLQSAIPDSFNVYYNGWSRSTDPSMTGVTIHHPQGDIMKVSTYKTPVAAVFWPGGTKLAHWQVKWSSTANGHGTTEPGSSGSPLFNATGSLIGTLTGGDSSCDSAGLNLPDYYGMFSYHWDKNGSDSVSQLKPWLDPINANVMEINGWALSAKTLQKAESLSIYPNPVSDLLNFSTPWASSASFDISIFDMNGKRVHEEKIHQASNGTLVTVQVAHLVPGLYYIQLKNENRVISGKFMKTRP